MKRLNYLALLTLLVLACGALSPSVNPPVISQGAIQTAIAQTQTASVPLQPPATNPPAATNTPSPTQAALPSPTTKFGTLANPFPYSVPTQLSQTSNGNTMYFILSISKTIRSSTAWSLIQSANMFNPAPPSDMEPILIQLTISDVTGSGTLAISGMDFAVASNGRITKNMDYSVCCLDKVQMDELDNVTLLAGGTATGWIASLEAVGDQNSLLVLDPLLLLDQNTASSSLYFALPPTSQ